MSDSILPSALDLKDSEKSTGSPKSDSSAQSFYSTDPQSPRVEYEHEQGPLSHPQQSAQRYDEARGGISTPQPSVENRQGPSSQSLKEEPTRTGLKPTQAGRRGPVQVAKEPEAVSAVGQEAVNVLTMYVITVSLLKCLTQFSQVPRI